MLDLRPVIIKSTNYEINKKGYFHKWAIISDDILGIIEFENGECKHCPIESIKFTDRDLQHPLNDKALDVILQTIKVLAEGK